MKYILSLCTILYFLTTTQQVAAEELGLQVSPAILRLKTEASKPIERSIKLSNPTDSTLQIGLQIQPIQTEAETGSIVFNPKDTDTLRFLETGVSLMENNEPVSAFVLLPNEEILLDLTIIPPANLSRDYTFSLIFLADSERTLETPSETLSAQTYLKAGIVLPVLVSINPSVPSAPKITLFETALIHTTNSIPFTLHTENTSNRYLAFTGEVTIRDIFGNIVHKIPLRNQTILAKSWIAIGDTKSDSKGIKSDTSITSKPLIASSDKIIFGKYTAATTLWTNNNSTPITSTLTFYVIPYKPLLVVLFLCIAILLIKKRLNKLNP